MDYFSNKNVSAGCVQCTSPVSFDNGVFHMPRGKSPLLRLGKHRTDIHPHAAHPRCLIAHFLKSRSDSVACPFIGCPEKITKAEVSEYKQKITQRAKKWQAGCLVLGTVLTFALRMWMEPRKPGLPEVFAESFIGCAAAAASVTAGFTGIDQIVDDAALTTMTHLEIALLASEALGSGVGMLTLAGLTLAGRHDTEKKDEKTMVLVTSTLGTLIAETATFLRVVQIRGMVFGTVIISTMVGTFVGRRFVKH